MCNETAKGFPLTKAQFGIWLGAQTPGHEGLYPLSALLRFPAREDAAPLLRAAEGLARQVEALRLRVRDGADGPRQFLGPAPAVCRRGFESGAALSAYFDTRARAPIALDGPLSQLEVLCAPGEAALLLRVHHIAADGAGLLLMLERFCALCAGEAPADPPSFLAHAAAHPVDPSPQDGADRDFWRNYLDGAPPAATPRPTQAGEDLEADWLDRGLDPALCRDLRARADELGVSPFHLFLAACALWISRACGTRDVVVYTPRLGRDTQPQRETPGMFTMAVPVRLRVDEDASFASLCLQAQAQSRAAAAHKHYGLSAILSDLESAGRPGALSQFTLSFYNGALNTHGLCAEPELRFAPAMTNLLTLHVADWAGTGAWRMKLDSRRGWWQEGEAARLADGLAGLLRQAAEHPQAPCAAFQLPSPQEKARLAALLRGPAPAPLPDETIHDVFRRQAALTPSAPAVLAADRDYTFAQLDAASDTVCQNLLALGLRQGDVAALQLRRTCAVPAVMLGVLKAGGAFLPMDCTWPEERRRFLLSDSGARLLIRDDADDGAGTCPDDACPADACADGPDGACPAVTARQLLRPAPGHGAPPALTAGDLAYVIYTSGTTGAPKGVLLRHRGLVNLARPDATPFNTALRAQGRALAAVGNFSFDISLFELFVPLLNGVAVALASEEEARDPEALAALIDRRQAGALHCTPSRLFSCLEVPAFRAAMAGVNLVLSAGEAFTRPLLEALRAATRAQIYNGYGPTETTIGATLGPVDDALTIGAPMAGVNLYILDGRQRLLPAGARGEICVGGAGVARGYLNRPQLTAEKFLDWSDGPVSDRIYRTGDFGWCLPDGRLMFSGRDDGQVKLRGLRIELEEIERRVEQFPGVRQCAVLVKTVEGRQHLCCYYAADAEYDPEALRAYAAAFLTRYMVPDWFFFLPSLPRTANGKLDRQALLALPVTLHRAHTPPDGPLEAQLCEIFSQVLDGADVGAQDSFFDLGGTSLLAARVVLLCKHAQLPIEYHHLFDYPTPRALRAFLEQGARRAESAPPCTPGDAQTIHALLAANRDYRAGTRPLGDVLLTGATGFLGAHILWELLHSTDCRVCCLVRPKGKLTPEKRLKGSLFYYFEDSFAQDFGRRLFVTEGDLGSLDALALPEGFALRTVINSAADVSHFGVDGAIRRTNADGAAALGDFCLKHGAALVHVSTMSVGGFLPRQQVLAGARLTERELWLGQDLSNVYLHSKFEAERRLLLAAAGRGLRVKIMRVGNLQGRASDGEFQINRAANGFNQLLRSIVRTGKCPQSLAESAFNFSPVDAVARAIVLLAGSKDAYTVFHIFDSDELPMSSLLELLPHLGRPVEILPDGDFDAYLRQAGADGADNGDLNGFLTGVSGGALAETPCESTFSIKALAREGFCWPALTRGYLRSCLEGLETLGFFD